MRNQSHTGHHIQTYTNGPADWGNREIMVLIPALFRHRRELVLLVWWMRRTWVGDSALVGTFDIDSAFAGTGEFRAKHKICVLFRDSIIFLLSTMQSPPWLAFLAFRYEERWGYSYSDTIVNDSRESKVPSPFRGTHILTIGERWWLAFSDSRLAIYTSNPIHHDPTVTRATVSHLPTVSYPS